MSSWPGYGYPAPASGYGTYGAPYYGYGTNSLPGWVNPDKYPYARSFRHRKFEGATDQLQETKSS